MQTLGPRIMVTAFDPLERRQRAATSAVEIPRSGGDYDLVHAVDLESYFDYQSTRPAVGMDPDSVRRLRWPRAEL